MSTNLQQTGRNIAMRDILDSLSPEGATEVADEVEAIRNAIRAASIQRTGKAVKLSYADAFELLWELLIFLDNPTELARVRKLERYQKLGEEAEYAAG